MGLEWGVCANFLGGDTYSLHTELLPELGRAFDFVEFPVMTVAELNEEDFLAFQVATTAAHVRCHVMTNLFPPRLHLLSEAFDPRELDCYLDVVLPRCRALGCKALVFGSGKARQLPPGLTVEQGYVRLAGLLNRHVLPRLAEQGMELYLEPLNPTLCNFIHTLGEGARLSQLCEGEVLLLADSLHLMDRPETAAELGTYRALIGHVHLSEGGRAAPGERLSPALSGFLGRLKEIGYSGNMSLECRMETPEARRRGREAVWTFWAGQ